MSFDRLAPHYRWMERLLAGERLQRARTAWLAPNDAPRNALLVGEGPGRFLAPALAIWPATRFTCADASPAMLAVARRAIPAQARDRVRFECRRLPDWTPEPEAFDAVVTHFFLDCFPAGLLDRVVAKLADAATPTARWWLADFALPDRGPARWRARWIHFAMYAFFRRVTRLPAAALEPPEPMLARHGFVRTRQREFEWGLIRSSCWRRQPPPEPDHGASRMPPFTA